MKSEFTWKQREMAEKIINDLIIETGSQTETAKKIGITQSKLNYYSNGLKISVNDAIKIEKAFKVPRSKLRPDIFNTDN